MDGSSVSSRIAYPPGARLPSVGPERPGPPERVGLGRQLLRQDLDGDVAIEARVVGLIDLPHTALPEEGGHVIVPETVTDVQRHSCESEPDSATS